MGSPHKGSVNGQTNLNNPNSKLPTLSAETSQSTDETANGDEPVVEEESSTIDAGREGNSVTTEEDTFHSVSTDQITALVTPVDENMNVVNREVVDQKEIIKLVQKLSENKSEE